ncbi:MAG: trypsin-like peptidase domain-containing protein [Chloroflexi bacterium]|nr:trypsin-like peptidase domain-containing protein [Chloroflexota bacterium]
MLAIKGPFWTLLLGLALVGCVQATPPSPTPTATPDLEATVEAIVAKAITTPSATPDAEATLAARVAATVAAIASQSPDPSATLTVTLTSVPTATFVPTVTATPTPEPTATTAPPTHTPLPPDTPLPTKTPLPEPTNTPTATPTPSIAQIVDMVENSLVQIVTSSGSGSGFVFEKDLIVTNAHVVGRDSTVEVLAHAGRASYTGEVIGVDEEFDLAVIRVTGAALPLLIFADSDQVEIGHEVIAIGFPLGDALGSSPTVTRGIASSFRRDHDINYIQTDAAINPGNSGGPLLNDRGEVIGINTLKFVGDIGSPIEGIGLAISSNDVSENVGALKKGRFVRLPWQTYRSRDFDYTINYPPTWTVDDSSSDFVVIDGGDFAGVTIEVFDLSESFWTHDELVEVLLEIAEEDAEDSRQTFKLTSSKEVRGPGGRKYQWVTYITRDSTGYCSEHFIDIIALHSDYPDEPYGYEVTASICEHSLDAYVSDRLDIVDSFKFP